MRWRLTSFLLGLVGPMLLSACGTITTHPNAKPPSGTHQQKPTQQQSLAPPRQKGSAGTAHAWPFAVLDLQAVGSDSAFALAELAQATSSTWPLSPVFVGYSGYLSLLRTTDGGAEWTDVSPPDPFPGVPDEYGTALDFLNQDTGWLAVEVGQGSTATIAVARTTDVGSTWQVDTFATPNPGGLYLDFTSPEDGWLLAMSTPAAGLMSKVLYATSDGGRTWQQASCSLGPGCPQTDGLLPADSYPTGISFFGSDGFVSALNHGDSYLWFYGSHDAGRTWQRIPLTVPKAEAQGYGDVYPPSFSGTSGRMFVQFRSSTGPDLVVYQSADGGLRWQPNAAPALPVSLGSPAQFGWTRREDGWVTSGDGKDLYRTTDGGQTWARTPLPSAAAPAASEGLLQIAFTSTQDGLLAASNHSSTCDLFTTHDGGQTWTPVAPQNGGAK